MKKLIVACVLICSSCFSQNAEDTLWSKNSIRFDVLGKTIGGVGIAFERNLEKRRPGKHPRAFTSIEGCIDYPVLFGYDYFMPGFGVRRNWSSRNKRMIFYTGISAGAFICFSPTPKHVRNYYDSTHFYGGWYVNPVEPLLLGDAGMKYLFDHFYIAVSFTPVLGYDRAYDTGLYVYPWGGISFGFRFKKSS